MKTKFILHGGGDGYMLDFLNKEKNLFLNSVRILLSYHSKPNHEWDKNFFQDKALLKEIGIPENQVIIGSNDLSEFKEQLKISDIIIFKGGSSVRLMHHLGPIEKELHELLLGKTIIGISAGCYMLSKIYYSNDLGTICNGFGILPVGTICHYNDTLSLHYQMLIEKNLNVRCYKIPEFTYIQITT